MRGNKMQYQPSTCGITHLMLSSITIISLATGKLKCNEKKKNPTQIAHTLSTPPHEIRRIHKTRHDDQGRFIVVFRVGEHVHQYLPNPLPTGRPLRRKNGMCMVRRGSSQRSPCFVLFRQAVQIQGASLPTCTGHRRRDQSSRKWFRAFKYCSAPYICNRQA